MKIALMFVFSLIASCGKVQLDHRLSGSAGNRDDARSQSSQNSSTAPAGAGLTGYFEAKFTSSAQETISAKLFADDSLTNETPGVLFYFPGINYADHEWMFPTLQTLSRTKKLIVVSLKNEQAAQWASTSGFRRDIQNFLEHVVAEKFKFDAKRLFVVGAATGGDFVLEQLASNNDWHIFQTAILLCGGRENAPSISVSSRDTRIVSIVSSLDKNFAGRKKTLDAFTSSGFSVNSIDPKTSGRCNFDVDKALVDALSTQ